MAATEGEGLASAVSVAVRMAEESSILSQDEKSNVEPPKKKFKIEGVKENKLEHRLGGILCCAVCLDLPRTAIYQCTNGHLMCAGCLTHLLADARLRDETATCPNCRIIISKDACSRNLAVEKAVSELPSQCHYCSQELPRVQLAHHESEECIERSTLCHYSSIGCPWRGPFHEVQKHEEACMHPNKTGKEVMESLQSINKKNEEDKQRYSHIFDLLSFEKITFSDLQFKPYRTDEFIHKLYYETSRFSAFNNQWVVKAFVNDNERDPTQSCERSLTYQLVLKSKPSVVLGIHYLILKGPFGDIKINPYLYNHEFGESSTETACRPLPMADSSDCNKLLSSKAINFRLIMFQVTK